MKYYILLWKSGHDSHYENNLSTFCPNSNTLIFKLDTVNRYTVDATFSFLLLCILGYMFWNNTRQMFKKTQVIQIQNDWRYNT